MADFARYKEVLCLILATAKLFSREPANLKLFGASALGTNIKNKGIK